MPPVCWATAGVLAAALWLCGLNLECCRVPAPFAGHCSWRVQCICVAAPLLVHVKVASVGVCVEVGVLVHFLTCDPHCMYVYSAVPTSKGGSA